MFVFDASNKFTFETLCYLIETIKEIEKSEARGKKTVIYTPKKLVVGNKKDLKKKKHVLDKADLAKLDGIRYKEVSALTNQGIYEAFKMLVTEMNSCNILNKAFYDLEKEMNKNKEDQKEEEDEDGQVIKKRGFFSRMPFFGCYGVSICKD